MQLGSPGPGTPGPDQVTGRVSAGQALSPEVKPTCLVERAGTVSFLDCRTGLRECPLLACPRAWVVRLQRGRAAHRRAQMCPEWGSRCQSRYQQHCLPLPCVILRSLKQTTNTFFAFLLKGTNSEGFAFRGRRGRDTVLS